MNDTDPEAIFARIQSRRPVLDGVPPAAADDLTAAAQAAVAAAGRTATAGAADLFDEAVNEAVEDAVDDAASATAQAARSAEAAARSAAKDAAERLAGAADRIAATAARTNRASPRTAPEPDGPFPRSAVMRYVLDHPVPALVVGLPLATLLLRSAASRRLIRAAMRLGAQPMVWEIARTSYAAARHFSGPPSPTGRPASPRPAPSARSASTSASSASAGAPQSTPAAEPTRMPPL